jgi:hypothetical protein
MSRKLLAAMADETASGGSEFTGWDLHPLESAALPRRTPNADRRHRSKFGIRKHARVGLDPVIFCVRTRGLKDRPDERRAGRTAAGGDPRG